MPSWKSCNGFGAKEEKDPYITGLKNPYLLNSSDFVFTHTIKNDDINLGGKYVKIKDGKNHQERLLPISDSLIDVLNTFLFKKKYFLFLAFEILFKK